MCTARLVAPAAGSGPPEALNPSTNLLFVGLSPLLNRCTEATPRPPCPSPTGRTRADALIGSLVRFGSARTEAHPSAFGRCSGNCSNLFLTAPNQRPRLAVREVPWGAEHISEVARGAVLERG